MSEPRDGVRYHDGYPTEARTAAQLASRAPPVGVGWAGRQCRVNILRSGIWIPFESTVVAGGRGTRLVMPRTSPRLGMSGAVRASHRISARLRRCLSRLLDGNHPWGSFDVRLGCHGWCRSYRLVVFPPGIGALDRRLVRLWRGWPAWGAVLWLLAAICLSRALPPAIVLTLALTGYVGVGALLFVLAGKVRSQVRSLSVTVSTDSLDGYLDRRAEATYAAWNELVGILTHADAMREQGAISPVEHELAWWDAYDRMGAPVGD
jgi:hypothetical protein